MKLKNFYLAVAFLVEVRKWYPSIKTVAYLTSFAQF